MAYILFIDESGHDRRVSPYEVLAGIAVEDSRVWNLITAIQDAEEHHFGRRVSGPELELKGRKLLKKKTYRLANQLEPIEPQRRAQLAERCLRGGSRVSKEELTALGQAKLSFVARVLELCAQHGGKALASIVDCEAPRPAGSFLRKDYSYLFQRFFYYLEDMHAYDQGIIVFDELERSSSHLLIGQMEEYFEHTAPGRARASRIIPEPFFVHSDLTTLVRVADFIAYIVAWAVRFGPMDRPARPEMRELAKAVLRLRHRSTRPGSDEPRYVWSFAFIDDLRPREEREDDEDDG